SHFNHRFYQKILHNVDLSINDEEKRIFAMIDLIESDFNRKDFPDVYQSLLAILDGQNKSLSQHAGSSLSERDLLMFTFYKGGTSVLADAYLIKGSLSGKHALFAYGYGIILQLADDLQDIEEDIMNQHDTPYNTSAKKMLLDNQFLKHDSLIKHLMNEIYDKNNKKTIALHQLLDRSISLLLFSGVSQNQKLFSKTFMKKYLKSSMFSYRIFKKYNKKFMKKASL
ncbi:MAG: class 1 isoprenoid biosynthesis enzyme, partial [Clostridia bacterium]|nr:class 1 isoprenoid biosynthesis enzyme [Clostridia bacterium]